MGVNDRQVCALRELVLARLAYNRAIDELVKAIGVNEISTVCPKTIDGPLSDLVHGKDPREICAADLAPFSSLLNT